jgi:aminoglycoside/choline kinase family phosphotransferase
VSEREAALRGFLEAAGWGEAERRPLGADWSQRRYERLALGDRTAVLMDAVADQPVGSFLAVGRWLRGIGLHAPEIYAADEASRILLLEDLGDVLVARAIAQGADERMLYELAVDVVLRFQEAPAPAFLPSLDDEGLLALLELFLEFEAAAADEAAKAQFREIWAELLPSARLGPDVFLYRDYHAENMLWLPHERGLWRLGLIDFQDAFRGPPLYDLVSLVQDARRDISADVAAAVVERYLEARPDMRRDVAGTAIAILGAQRALRILGVLRRLETVQGRSMPISLGARVRRHLVRNLKHPVLAGLRGWCERHAPGILSV